MGDKRVLMIANSKIQLMDCIQIKKSLLGDAPVDIIMAHPSLLEVYRKGHLVHVFESVKYCNPSSFQQTLRKFFSPQIAVKELLGELPPRYTDVFFWNPDMVFYSLYKYMRGWKVKYHIYVDGTSIYFKLPDGFHRYSYRWKGRLMSFLDKVIWNWDVAEDIDCDLYLFEPRLAQFECPKPMIAIPPMKTEDIMEFCELFGYTYAPVEERCIFVDMARDGDIKNDDVRELIRAIQNCVGAENLLVRKHPRVDDSCYDGLGVRLMDQEIPWELFYMLGGLEGKILIALMGSTTMMAYFLNGSMADTIVINDMIPTDYRYTAQMRRIHEILAEETGKIHFVGSVEELRDTITNIGGQ